MEKTSSPLSEAQMLSIIRDGLPRTTQPKKVLIAGAGIAGLVAGSLLKQAGHHVTIVEASERVGGRVLTLRAPFTDGHYVEAGAMRIPNTHLLTMAYIAKFGLPLNEFINSTPNDLIYVNGIKTRRRLYEHNPDLLHFPVAPHEKGKSADALALMAIRPLIDFIKKHPAKHWPIVIKEYDRYSMEYFLRHNPISTSLSAAAVDKIKVMSGFEGFPELSFLEIFRDFILFDTPTRFYEITGGFDLLPQAFAPSLNERIRFHHKVDRISQKGQQIVFSGVDTATRTPFELTGDIAIITIPFPVLQFIDVEPSNLFSFGKWKAIHQLHYVSSTKIALQFSRRFWEEAGLYGGQAISDLPLRFSYFPSHGFDQSGGVVLASYTWEDDALPWLCLSHDEKIWQALRQLAVLFGEQVYKTFVTGVTHHWLLQPYAGGGFALFKPFQETELSAALTSMEGPIIFAGEHTSPAYHGWIQGAIESGVRAAVQGHHSRIGFF
ncbi:flavin monoamine oxidase family protein [Brevibacillus sp. HD3.3A]|uniref:flavin monoamine oxidase family protein n=1 Tax=Brevibacillus sp. HD3.3A TaxID=2738979 RepID=UPI00156B4F02|nr:flavin monoamine oxidase family protein [Brevibacillus sp. HD3.3A]UED67362.1 flavin monoamine oxidase family protein [Brevibacillus sp. HD3.3A]